MAKVHIAYAEPQNQITRQTPWEESSSPEDTDNSQQICLSSFSGAATNPGKTITPSSASPRELRCNVIAAREATQQRTRTLSAGQCVESQVVGATATNASYAARLATSPHVNAPSGRDHAPPRLAREEEHNIFSTHKRAGCRSRSLTPPGGWLFEALGREHSESVH